MLTLIIISIPFVNFIIWILLYIFNVQRDDFSIFLIIGPVTTTISVVVIIIPFLVVWSRLFRQLEYEASRASKAQNEAERLLAQRTEFVAYVSHEIRNPLNGIIGIAEGLDSSKLDPNTQKNIGIIRSSAHDLMYILNDILDMSKIDQGQVELNPSEVSLHDLLTQIYNFWKARAENSGLKFEIYFCDTFPDYVNIDAQRFRQVVNNLVSNAIKYSEKGTILISAECDPPNRRAEIIVQDTGIGVPPAMQKQIFHPYKQVGTNGQKDQPSKIGTGLGLPIARRLARLMGGDVKLVESSRAGSKFKFSFAVEPLPTPNKAKIQSARLEDALHKKTALIADDSMASAIVAREHLNKLGLQSTLLRSGQDAIHKLQNQQFDIILLDDDLGDMRGSQVLEKSKTPTAPNANSIFIAYTGRVEQASRQDFSRAGFNGYIPKPALLDDVKDELARILLEPKAAK